MAPVSNGTKNDPRPPTWKGAVLRNAIGAPSTGLSLVELRPRRARLRFTRQRHGNQTTVQKQEQVLVKKGQPRSVNSGGSGSLRNVAYQYSAEQYSAETRTQGGGSVFDKQVGPFSTSIST
jgi:hypothetical protein